MSSLREDREALEKQNEKAQQAEVVYNWRVKHPEYNYDAAVSMLVQYHHGEEITESSLDESAERLFEKGQIIPLRQDRLDAATKKQAEEEQEAATQERENLTEFICQNRRMQPETEASERARFMNPLSTAIETLRSIKDNILAKRDLQAKSPDELKALAKEEMAQTYAKNGIRQSQWQDVPAYYRNKSILKSLSAEDFRNLLRRCGRDNLNAILQSPSSVR